MIYKSRINNTPVYFQASNSLPMVDIQLNFRAGSAFDGNLHGLADIAVGMFATQTKSLSEQELINKITDIGASIHAETSKEYFVIKVRILNDTDIIEQTTDLLREIFANPNFDSDILDREKQQSLTNINYLRQQPGYLASLEFSRTLFANNPYGEPTIGHKESVSTISIDDIKNFFNKYICANNTNICIVGDITEHASKIIAEELINSLSDGAKNIQTFPQEPIETQIVNKKFESKQTSILLGHQLFLNIDDPLYFPLKLGNEILGGGGLNSLFFNKVREELGLVYNIGSSVSINPDYGSFIISAQTSNPALALETINEVYREFVASTIDDTTLKNSKNHIEGTHLLSSVKNSSKLSMLSSIANKSLELDFFDTYVDNINSVTSEDIKDAFTAIQHNQSLTVMVGDI